MSFAAPTTTATIRPAEKADLEHMVRLLKALFAIEEDFEFDPARQREGLAMLLDKPQACLLAAELDGRVVGMASGQLLVSTAEGGPAALVEDVVVHESARGRGIGRALVEGVAAWSRANGVTRLQLLADHGNTAALDFYEHIGWTPTNLVCLRRNLPTGACA